METSESMYQETKNIDGAVSKHCPETHAKQPNEILKDENAASNANFNETSPDRSFIGACSQDEQSEIRLDGERQQAAAFELHDDVSSIFSDQESDMKEREILQEALLQLKKENHFGLTDTSSEYSDDLSESGHQRDNCLSRPEAQRAQESVVKDNAKYARERAIKQCETEPAHQTHCQDATKAEHQNKLQHILRRIPQSPTSHQDERTTRKDLNGVQGVDDRFCGSDSSDSGYISDIAVLARENEKLSEILDHLHMHATSYPQEGEGYLEVMERYVGKDQFDMVDNERFELESKLRERERRIREQERAAEEEKYEHEEERRILNRSLTKAEKKAEEKVKELHDCEVKMRETTAKHFKQLGNAQSKLESAREENFKLEETILVLQKLNTDFNRELQGMKQHIVNLEEQEEQLEERRRRDIGKLEDCLQMESQEKDKLKQTVEGLRQEIMQTKARMLEQAGKHAVEQELNSKLKTENEAFAVTGNQTITKTTSCMLESEDMTETTSRKSGATQEGTGHEADIEKRIHEEQQRRMKLEEENRAMNAAILSGDYSLLQSLFSGGRKTDVKSTQRKLSETLEELKEAQLKNEEGEGETKRLKRKNERLEREVGQMRELQDKNEELHVELERAKRRLHEVQRAAENTREEMEQMTQTVRKLKDENLVYKNETDSLRVKIKQSERLLTETRAQVTNYLEEEKMAELHNLRLEQEDTEKINQLENDKLRQALHEAREMLRASEEKDSTERSEMIESHTKEMDHMKEKCASQQEELNTTAKMVREVTQEWEKMLRNTASRNEEKLQKMEEGKRQIHEELLRKTQEMDRQLSMCKCNSAHPGRDVKDMYPGEHFELDLQHKQSQGTTEVAGNVQAEERELGKSLPGADKHTKEEEEDKLQALTLQHELEMKELREKLYKESKEARERLKTELTRSLVIKSVILESRIEGLVVKTVQEERQRNRRLVAQYEREKQKYSASIRRLTDKIQGYETDQGALDEEKGELEATVTKLRNELCSSKAEANERREREAKQMEEEFEKENENLQETSEKCIERATEKVEGEYCRKATSERHNYEDDIQQLTAAVMLVKEKMEQKEPECAECAECSKRGKPRQESSSENATETTEKLDQEHERKLLKEKENISSALESLREEIRQLEAQRHQLQIGVYDRREKTSYRVLHHAHPIRVDIPEVLLELQNESHQQVQHERGVLKDKATELEREVERLHQEMHQQEARSRRDHVQMRREFQNEKEEMEEEFRREKNGWRAQMSALAAKANLQRLQAAFDGGRFTTKRNITVFYRNHVSRTVPVTVKQEAFTAAPGTTHNSEIAFT